MIIDGDEAKKTIPEFGNGVGANAVHIESKLMADHLTEQAIQQGENILLPKDTSIFWELDKDLTVELIAVLKSSNLSFLVSTFIKQYLLMTQEDLPRNISDSIQQLFFSLAHRICLKM